MIAWLAILLIGIWWIGKSDGFEKSSKPVFLLLFPFAMMYGLVAIMAIKGEKPSQRWDDDD